MAAIALIRLVDIFLARITDYCKVAKAAYSPVDVADTTSCSCSRDGVGCTIFTYFFLIKKKQ